MKATVLAVGTGVALAFLPGVTDPRAAPHLQGAPVGHAGVPGEATCHACHDDLELNEPEGRIDVSGFPSTYAPGDSHVVTVTLHSEGMAVAGFQVAARRGGNADAGTLEALDPRTVVVTGSLGRAYLGHTAEGTGPVAADRTSWTFEWIAPEGSAGTVTLRIAANSANGDNSPLGDFIYTTHRVSHSRRQ